MTKYPQNLVKGQSHSDLGSSSSKASNLAQGALTFCCAMTSCSMNSWMIASFIGPSRHCSAAETTFSSSSPHPSISMNSW
jgi:hypothetical protein